MDIRLFYTVSVTFLYFWAFSTASASHGHGLSSIRSRRNWSAFTNLTTLREDPRELQRRDGSKYVFMHHIVGNTYPYSYTDWKDDMVKIAAKGVDAIALNIGQDGWQRTQVATAYRAALDSGTGIKLFYSFDLTEMPCNVDDLVDRVNLYANHPSQFKVNGKVMISSFSGDCLGHQGWSTIKSRTNGYLMPFISGLEGNFQQWPSLDSWYCWGCAWPQGNYAKNTGDDNYYISQLGSKYATTISCWFYTHLNSKNFYLRGDDWLIVSRWEQLMDLRNALTFVEMATWNDWGESNYFGPFKGAQPYGTFYAESFPHTAWYDLSEYYIKAFKTGSYPAITTSKIFFWARTHPKDATASADPLPKPNGWDWTEDSMWAVVQSTGPATVILKCGRSSNTFNVGAGVSKLKIPLAVGQMTVQMIRGGQTIISYTPSGYSYIANPARYNYNAWVGSAAASTEGSAPTTTSTITTSTATTISSSSPTSTSGWSYVGCYSDSNTRVLSGLSTSDNAQTVAKCQVRCQNGGYLYAGVEYGVECFCSNSITAGSSVVAESECSMPCAGNNSEKCGASYRINVYRAGTASSPAAWSNYGCVAEGTTGTRRALTGASYSESNMTPLRCQNLCAGYTYAGTEYGNQCYCGNTLTNNGASGAIVGANNCQSACPGDPSSTCGGSWHLGVYKASSSSSTSSSATATTTSSTTSSTSTTVPTTASSTSSSTSTTTTSTTGAAPSSTPTGWKDYGCVAEGTTGTRRALTGPSFSRSSMTPAVCQGLCARYLYAGTEYGSECFCGDTLTNNGATGTIISPSQCQVSCSGDSTKKCGGSWTMNVYTTGGTTASWTSAGCYTDASTRMLRGSLQTPTGLTTEGCISICASQGATIAGTENGGQCFCGTSIYKEGGAGISAPANQCVSPCVGNAEQICGGSWRLNIYLKPGTTI